MKICVIILNYNLANDTVSLVSDLKRQTIPKDWNLEIIVVDNASTDNSIEEIKKAHRDIIVLPQNDNLGVAGGYNAGIRYALENESDIVVVSNNDLIIEQNNCLELLVKGLLSKVNIGITVPLIYFAKGYEYHGKKYKDSHLGKVIWYAGGIIDWNNILMSHKGVDELDNGQYSEVSETDFITGAFMVFKREVLEKTGLFNENYHLYLEDAEISQRVKRAGYKLLLIPQAKISHKVSQTAGNSIGGGMNDYYITRNRLLFGMQYAKLRTKFALLREAVKLLFVGRIYQKMGVWDFLTCRLGRKEINAN